MKLEVYTTGDFQRGASQWKEALWIAVKTLFFMNPLPWPSPLRVGLLKAFGARIGRGVVVRSHVNITFPWRFEVGDHVWIGEGVEVLSLAPVRIGSDVCISQRAFLCTGSHRFGTPMFDLVTKPITIHDRTWIAAQVFVAPGIEIGPDSLAAAGSIVTETVPPHTMVQGNPAVPVKVFPTMERDGSSANAVA
jgi:putative colanic acid biosynthesis acetyltransferase WcaF